MHSFLVRNAAALLWSAWRRRYLIAIPIVIMPLLALGFGVLSPKKYMSYTTVLIQEAAKLNPKPYTLNAKPCIECNEVRWYVSGLSSQSHRAAHDALVGRR